MDSLVLDQGEWCIALMVGDYDEPEHKRFINFLRGSEIINEHNIEVLDIVDFMLNLDKGKRKTSRQLKISNPSI
jgi:hypothetical protein